MIFRSTLAAALLLMAAPAFAQNVTVKASPANDALVKAAKDYTAANDALAVMRQQANSALDQNRKTLSDQVTAAQKALSDKLRVDKKYGKEFGDLENLQKQFADAGQKANTDFGQRAAPLMQRINVEKPLMDGLIPIVRQENNLPDNAAFDEKTGTWSVPKAEPKK